MIRPACYAALAAALLSLTLPAAAQNMKDPDFLLRTINALQQQRNLALDQAVVADAQRAQLADEVAKLKADGAKLKAEIEALKPADPAK